MKAKFAILTVAMTLALGAPILLAQESSTNDKSAILATNSTIIHYAKLHALLTQGSAINVRIFQDRQEAAQWLNAPIALLMPDAADAS